MEIIQAAHELPKPDRTQGMLIVLECLRQTYEVLPEDAELAQTARVLALMLRGDVSERDFEEAWALWLLRTQIAEPTGDLEWLLDLPNTPENREAEVAKAQSNLIAAVSAMLDKAGVK